MLIVTRKVGEKIMVYQGNPPDPQVVVTVVSVNGLQVKIGVDAPGFHVDREEVYRKKPGPRGPRP
jgi:carbon storage regulator CsrA